MSLVDDGFATPTVFDLFDEAALALPEEPPAGAEDERGPWLDDPSYEVDRFLSGL